MGSSSEQQGVTLFNNNGQSHGDAIAISGFKISAGFQLDTGTCGAVLPPDQQCTVYVTFVPTSSGDWFGTLTINDDASNAPQTVDLKGRGISP